MEVTNGQEYSVGEATQAGEARRGAMLLAREVGFDEVDAGRVGIVVTEAATNLVKHARDGRLLIQLLKSGALQGIAALAIDRGPGVSDLAEMMRDGFSTAGSPGTGLGAIERQSNQFQVYSSIGKGTAVLATIWQRGKLPASAPAAVGGVSVPVRGEQHCGDGWALATREGRTYVLVVDGVGHGPLAHEAAARAIGIFQTHAGESLEALLRRMHEPLRAGRGAAALVVELSCVAATVRCCGIGNIVGRIFTGENERNLVSHFGTLGHDMPRLQEFEYAWPRGASLVLHSDGLGNHWKLGDYPGLAGRDPTLIAGVLFRDHSRGRDDCTVVVARNDS